MSWGRPLTRSITVYQLIYLMIHIFASRATAGVCWLSMDTSSGLCRNAFSLNISRADCCDVTSGASVSWSPHSSPSRSMVFYWNYLAAGATRCQRCHSDCRTVNCGPEKTCKMRTGHPECLCRPKCDKSLKALGAVCGTDGQRYRHYCALQRSNCYTERQVRVAYLGKCRKSCKRVKCYHGNHCLQDQNGMPHCVSCSERCQLDLADDPADYVCGADGHTYKNTCELRAAICRKGRSLRISYRGPCVRNATCANTPCPGATTCLSDPASGQPRCTDCTHPCMPSTHIPVCGTDGQTYPSYCRMQEAACTKRTVINTLRSGACPGKRKMSSIRRKSLRKRRKQHHRTKTRIKNRRDKTKKKDISRRKKGNKTSNWRHSRKTSGRKRRKKAEEHDNAANSASVTDT